MMLAKKKLLAWGAPLVAGMLLLAVGVPSIVHAQGFTITTTALPNGEQGVAYSQTLAATGGTTPYTWSISAGSLPTGLNLDASTGTISGSPTATGTAAFTVKVTDSAGTPDTTTKALTITIAAPLSVSTTALADGQVGVTYLQTLATMNGVAPDTWSITAGSLPAGLTLDSTSGSISGTPTTAGSSNFTVQATDTAGGTATKALSISVIAPLSITTTTLPAGVVGTSYSQTLAATGGTTPYTWSISAGALPAGLNLDASTGMISGTPTTAGTSDFTVKVTDSSSPAFSATQALSVTVNSTATVTITTTTLPAGVVGTSYSQTLAATGGTTPYTWSISTGALPAGLNLDTSTGMISGTPTTAGSSSFTVQVTDSSSPAESATQAFSITIVATAQAPAFTSPASATFTVGQASSFTITTTGSPTPVITESGGLPNGITYTTNGNGTATLAGTPAAGSAGTYHLLLTASNGVTPNATQSFTLTIQSAPTTVPSGAAMTDLDNLAASVQGVGPGRSLEAKVHAAQADVASGATLGACGVLNGFMHEVMAQSGKKIPTSVASALISEAQQAESALSCGSGTTNTSQDEVGHPQEHQPLTTSTTSRESDTQLRFETEFGD